MKKIGRASHGFANVEQVQLIDRVGIPAGDQVDLSAWGRVPRKPLNCLEMMVRGSSEHETQGQLYRCSLEARAL
jgi:hypothetical protein